MKFYKRKEYLFDLEKLIQNLFLFLFKEYFLLSFVPCQFQKINNKSHRYHQFNFKRFRENRNSIVIGHFP